MITIRVQDKGIISRLLKLREKAAAPDKAMAQIGSSLVDEIKLGFAESRSPYGAPWKPLKVRVGQPLLDTGKLRNSITYRVIRRDAVMIGTADFFLKAATHQFGSDNAWGRRIKVPARPYLPIRNKKAELPPAWRTEVLEILREHLDPR